MLFHFLKFLIILLIFFAVIDLSPLWVTPTANKLANLVALEAETACGDVRRELGLCHEVKS